MRTICFTIQKGGSGKTTSCLYAARYFASIGKRVLVIDADPQGDATTLLKAHADADHDLALVLGGAIKGERTLVESVIYLDREGFALIPTWSDLENIQVGLAQRTTGAQTVMRKAIRELRSQGHFDLVLIDCPTGFGLLTVNMIVASDLAIVPAQPEPSALRGVGGGNGTQGGVAYLLSELADNEFPVPTIAGVIATMVDGRSVRHRAGLALLRGDLDAFDALNARLDGEYSELRKKSFPRLLGVIPKFNSINAHADLLAAYAAVYSGMGLLED